MILKLYSNITILFKKLRPIILILGFLINTLNAQDITIKSDEIDRLVWTKINDRLERLGKNRVPDFENGVTRSYARRVVAKLHDPQNPFKHSDSIAYYATGYECIQRIDAKTTPAKNNKYIKALKEGNLDSIAMIPVTQWINSPSHNHAISQEYLASTVSTIITYNELTGKFRLTSVWLSLGVPNPSIHWKYHGPYDLTHYKPK